MTPLLRQVTGMQCVVENLYGLYTRDDRLMLLDTCGTPRPTTAAGTPQLVGAPGYEGSQTSTAPIESGTFYFPVVPLTFYSGQYRMCWCAKDFACSLAEDFKVDAGELYVQGPKSVLQRTCVSGQTCRLDDLNLAEIIPAGYARNAEMAKEGVDLGRFMILETCGIDTVRAASANRPEES